MDGLTRNQPQVSANEQVARLSGHDHRLLSPAGGNADNFMYRLVQLSLHGSDGRLENFLVGQNIDRQLHDKTAAQHLARNGFVQACNRLRSLGADNARIAQGYAEGGNINLALEVMTNDIQCKERVAAGAAFAGNSRHCLDILRDPRLSPTLSVIGAIKGGHEESTLLVESLINTRSATHQDLAKAVGFCNLDRSEYMSRVATSQENHALIACYAALGGHRNLVEFYFPQLDPQQQLDVVEYAARSGDRDAAFIEQLTQGLVNFRTRVGCGAAEGGHKDYADSLIRGGANLQTVARHAVIGGHKTHVLELLDSGSIMLPARLRQVAIMHKKSDIVQAIETYVSTIRGPERFPLLSFQPIVPPPAQVSHYQPIRHEPIQPPRLTQIQQAVDTLNLPENFEDQISREFKCPITLGLMKDPVVISSGQMFDRQAIAPILGRGGTKICPITRQPLRSIMLKVPVFDALCIAELTKLAAASGQPNPS